MAFGKPTWGVAKELSAHLQNGVGRYVCQLQRLTLRFCKHRVSSKGLREFIELELVDFARKNPGIVIYLQPRRHRAPKLYGEYLSGKHQSILVSNLSLEIIGQWVELMRTRGGDDFYMVTPRHTDSPTVQGYWTPWTNKPTWVNAIPPDNYPHDVRAAPYSRQPTASDRLMEILAAERQEQSNIVVMNDENNGDTVDKNKT